MNNNLTIKTYVERGCSEQRDQIGRFLKVKGKKFSCKSIQKYFKKHNF